MVVFAETVGRWECLRTGLSGTDFFLEILRTVQGSAGLENPFSLGCKDWREAPRPAPGTDRRYAELLGERWYHGMCRLEGMSLAFNSTKTVLVMPDPFGKGPATRRTREETTPFTGAILFPGGERAVLRLALPGQTADLTRTP